MSNEVVSLNKRKGLALVLVALYALTTVWVLIVTFDLPVPIVNPPPQEDSFQMTYQLYMHPGAWLPIEQADISIGLNVYYVGRIVVGQSIRIQAIAELLTPKAQSSVKRIGITFPNALAWPPQKDANGILEPTGITLLHNTTDLMGGTQTMFWTVLGTYSVIAFTELVNGTILNYAPNPAVSIQVLPVETLTELRASKVDAVLAWALFILTALGVINGAVELWEPSS